MQKTTFKRPWYSLGRHGDTLLPMSFHHKVAPLFTECWPTPDGDFLDVSWFGQPAKHQQPIVMLFHGVAGSAQSHYAQSIMAAVNGIGWTGLVVHFRGCSHRANRKARAFHAGDSAEIAWLLKRLANDYPANSRCAVGISLGGNMLAKWLGETGVQASNYIHSAVSVCAPLQLPATGLSLSRGFMRYSYGQAITYWLKKHYFKRRHLLLNSTLNLSAIEHAQTVQDFDDHLTAPLHGFTNALDYWQKSQAYPLLGQIAVPTLLLHSRNDPIVDASTLPGANDVSASTLLEIHDQGGHTGFYGRWPYDARFPWLGGRIIEFHQQSIA